jgi:signal recognition particle GTPase
MEPSSRTPEGEPNRCPLCGKEVKIEPSRPPGDATCAHCGHLLWFGPKERNFDQEELLRQESGLSELVEPAQQKQEQEGLAEQETRRRQVEFTLDDFKTQLSRIVKLGPITKIMSMIPGMTRLANTMRGENPEADLKRLIDIIDAMTPEERRNPPCEIDKARRQRIAADARVETHEVDNLIQQFEGIADFMKKWSGKSMLKRMRRTRHLDQ